ncbi:MAG: DUF4396 domain-containing protein [Gammaproteobacteria bacterium]|nr:DUF4396 domain-containing protein [Gammaproteobacteria bacterium]
MFWNNLQTWKQSAYNTMWCLIGCAIGDFGTIAYFQFFTTGINPLLILTLAVVNGLITSVILETIILMRKGMVINTAFRTAMGMSFISMVSMEVTMNITDYFLTGGAKLVWWVIPVMLVVGFLTPWPYNYWRLEKLGESCCH